MSDAIRQPLADFYKWGFAGSPIQIHLNIELVSRLRKQIQDSAKEPGVLAACGLLTGEAHKPGITAILDFIPLETLDAASVEQAKGGASGQAIGFYRTIPTGLASMPEDDSVLAGSCFRHPGSVFMLVETGEPSIGNAHFCFWDDGKIFDWPLMAFPFDAAELAAKEGNRRLYEVPTPPADREQVSRAPQPVAERRQGSRRGWLVLALATAVVVLVFAVSLWYSWRNSTLPAVSRAAAPTSEAPAPLGLSVERRGKDLRVSWNGNAERIAKADFGMLLIRGSAVSRDVPLTAEELRAGSVAYTSAVDELRLQLNVVGGGQVAREFLTVVMPPEGERPVNRPSPPSGNSEAGGVRAAAAASASAGAREFRQFKAPGTPAGGTAPSLAEPPPVSGSAPLNNVASPLLNPPAVAAKPPISGEAAPTLAPTTLPGPTTASDSEARPPLATRQVVPPVPALLRGLIWKPATVDVNVLVDASGNVVKAEAPDKAGLHPLLREAAIQAALRWKFQPAQFNGHAVPANMVLQFNFATNR